MLDLLRLPTKRTCLRGAGTITPQLKLARAALPGCQLSLHARHALPKFHLSLYIYISMDKPFFETLLDRGLLIEAASC